MCIRDRWWWWWWANFAARLQRRLETLRRKECYCGHRAAAYMIGLSNDHDDGGSQPLARLKWQGSQPLARLKWQGSQYDNLKWQKSQPLARFARVCWWIWWWSQPLARLCVCIWYNCNNTIYYNYSSCSVTLFYKARKVDVVGGEGWRRPIEGCFV